MKRLSDVFDDELTHLVSEFGDETVALSLLEADPKLVKMYLPETARWNYLRLRTEGRSEALTAAMREVVKIYPNLAGVIDVVDFNATTAGQRIVDEPYLKSLIDKLSEHRLGLEDVEPDMLGRAYEYLLRKFAEGGGRSGGEFFTPQSIGFLIRLG